MQTYLITPFNDHFDFVKQITDQVELFVAILLLSDRYKLTAKGIDFVDTAYGVSTGTTTTCIN